MRLLIVRARRADPDRDAVVLVRLPAGTAPQRHIFTTIGYTLYRNVLPHPTGAVAWFPVVCGVWELAAIVYVLARPGVARRSAERLTAEEGLAQHVR
jgi:hypothetical protein